MSEKIIQFGEGGFLRGFADWMIKKVNDTTDFEGSIVVVQPIENGTIPSRIPSIRHTGTFMKW